MDIKLAIVGSRSFNDYATFNYVMNKINHAIEALLKDQDAGEMKMRIKDHDYNQMWNDYNAGHITASELTKMLFSYH